MHYDCHTTHTGGEQEEGDVYCKHHATRRTTEYTTEHTEVIEDITEIKNEMVEEDAYYQGV